MRAYIVPSASRAVSNSHIARRLPVTLRTVGEWRRHFVRCAEYQERQTVRPNAVPSSPGGVPQPPRHDQKKCPGGIGHPPDPGQLRHTQNPTDPRLAGEAASIRSPAFLCEISTHNTSSAKHRPNSKSSTLRGAPHFSRAPSGTSSRNPASTGAPSSSDAASSMPCDSNPRILRGARFATITIFRPMSFSGS